MIIRDLLLVDTFTSELKGQTYEIDVFVDEATLNLFYGCNLKNLQIGNKYTCELYYNPKKHNKIVVNKIME